MSFIYFICSMFNINLDGMGKARLDSALSSFTKAKQKLQKAVDHENNMINQHEEKLINLKLEFEANQTRLEKNRNDHNDIKTSSEKYLQKIEKFLSIDED